MDATFAKKTDKKTKGQAPPTARPDESPSLQGELGATVGMPLFLQRSVALASEYASIPPRTDKEPVQTNLVVGQAKDAAEQEADRVSNALDSDAGYTREGLHGTSATLARGGRSAQRAPHAPSSASPDARDGPQFGGGHPLDSATRDYFQRHLQHDFGDVSVHTDTAAAASARALGALAYTAGSHIAFDEGRFSPHTTEGRRLLAHELTHVVQQRRGSSPMIQRQPVATSAGAQQGQTSATAAAPSDTSVYLIPPERVREPGAQDLLVAVLGGQMVVLPARVSMVVVTPPRETTIPIEPLVTVTAAEKEGAAVVNVGGRIGFQLDVGGRPTVLFPAALAAIQQALGIDSIRQVMVTHIHDDHVRNLVALVKAQQIRPENIHFPEAFGVNPAAPGSTFARALRALQTDPDLRQLGHGPTAAYGAIRAPASGTFFRNTLREGQVTFDYYGLTQAFQDLETQRRAGGSQGSTTVGGRSYEALADTASLLVRATHEPSGMRVLFLGDLRGSDLTRFRTAMGEAAYDEMVSGVRVIEGFQHHMGALESPADRAGLVDLITRTYLQTGSLSVVVQSQEVYPGTPQFLNRSLIRALTDMGVNVSVAHGPQAGAVGTITVDTAGQVAPAGGQIESFGGAAEMQGHVQRLITLRRAEEILTRYERFVPRELNYKDPIRRARETLERNLTSYVETTIGGVQRGAAGRGQAALDPAVQTQQQQQLRDIRARDPMEDMLLLMPSYMSQLEEVDRVGPFAEIVERELMEARRTGRMSDEGITALWELDPEVARQLVTSSGMSPSAQRATMADLPGQMAPMGTRVGATILLAITVFQEAAPFIEQRHAESFDKHVRPALEDIMWWQSKGVFPSMIGVNDRWWPRSNEWTEDPKRIQELLNSDDLNYLSLTGIREDNWDAFTIWVTTHIRTYPDWYLHIEESTAIRSEGPHTIGALSQLRWFYRKGNVKGEWIGFGQEEEWVYSERLTTILRASAIAMLEPTKRQISGIATESRAVSGEGPIGSSGPAFAGKPQAIGRKRFKQDIDNPTLYNYRSGYRHPDSVTGFSRDDVFYVFPEGIALDKVPTGYLVVGGADIDTYAEIYAAKRHRMPFDREVLLARTDDLEDAPP